MALQSVSEGRQGEESEGRLVDVGRKGFIYVCILCTRGVVDYIGDEGRVVAVVRSVYWRWGAHFDGNFHCPTSTNICLVTRFQFPYNNLCRLYTYIYVYVYIVYVYARRTGSRAVHNIAFMVCQSPASILIASRKIQLCFAKIRAARHAQRTVPSRRTERDRERAMI